MKKPYLPGLLLALLLVGAAGGQAWASIRPYALTVSPFAGAYIFEGNQKLDNRAVYGLAVGYNFSEHWAGEAAAAYVDTRTTGGVGTDADVYLGRLDVLYHFRPDKLFVPYLAGGIGGIITDLDGDNTAGIDSDEDGLLNYGLGFKYFFTENAAVRADVRHIFDFNLKDELEGDAFNNLAATAGLFMQFGASQPARVAAAMPKDTDGDGVVDQFDRCPDTLLGVPVDGYGCPADSDRDGVLDYLDACPGTPAGTAVGQNGCPPQPRVEASPDGDGDGVEDGRDKCPNTPSDIPVNSYSCPSDSDGDGVFDFDDRCPETPKGAAVDATGCPMPAPPVTPTAPSLTLYLEFAYGEAAVRPEFARDLQTAAEFIKAHPGSRILIEGHTDSIGSVEANLALSKARAAEVRRYLVEKFNLDVGRFETKGFGEARPVADNATPEGRLRNRRVVITVLPVR
jgi:OOP family OmpA-OmpF porin